MAGNCNFRVCGVGARTLILFLMTARDPNTSVQDKSAVLSALYLILALGVPIVYVMVTHHVWEDFLITFRHSQNLVEGRGLVYQPGERVQGFTSPMNTLLPAAFYWFVGGSDYSRALNLYRVVSLLAYVGGGWVILRLMLIDRGADRWSPLVFILLYTTEAKTVAYTMNGQETAFMVAFLCLGFAAIYRGPGKFWRLLALGWTGLLYTRPDAPVFIAALGVSALVFSAENQREIITGLLKAGGVAALAYLPWFAWSWWYYGQPIPNTLLAKSIDTPGYLLVPGNLGSIIISTLESFPIAAGSVFEPIYASVGGWPQPWLDLFGMACAVVSAFYWMIPSRDHMGRLASLLFLFTAAYLSFVRVWAITAVAPWYLPSAGIFGTIALARAAVEIAKCIPGVKRSPVAFARVFQGCVLAVAVVLLVTMTMEMRIQQREIEQNNRRVIGLWLHDNVKPGQTVMLEPLGYIGYYSNAHILDWPGLVAPAVVRLRREKNAVLDDIVLDLKPDWIVLRPDWTFNFLRFAYFRENYAVEHVFDVSKTLDHYSYIPGKGYLDSDSIFIVVHRKTPD